MILFPIITIKSISYPGNGASADIGYPSINGGMFNDEGSGGIFWSTGPEPDHPQP